MTAMGSWPSSPRAMGLTDMLINIAGIVDYAPVAEVDLVSWQRTMGVDPDGVMLGMWAMIN